MASISNLRVGQVLWQRRRVKCGNTKSSRNCVYPVSVISVSDDKTSIMASWNGNPARKFSARDVRKLLIKKPEPKSTILGMPNY